MPGLPYWAHILIYFVRPLVKKLDLLHQTLGTMSEAMGKAQGTLHDINSELKYHMVHINIWILAKC